MKSLMRAVRLLEQIEQRNNESVQVCNPKKKNSLAIFRSQNLNYNYKTNQIVQFVPKHVNISYFTDL